MRDKLLSSWPGLLVLLTIVGCGGAGELTTPTEPARDFLVAGYHPWWTQEAWRRYDASVYDEIYFFSLEIDSAGRIAERNGWPDRWFSMQRALTDRSVRVSPVVTLDDPAAFVPLFTSEERMMRLQDVLLGLFRDSPAIGGLQIDFEVFRRVPEAARSNFSQFVGRLRERMDAARADLVLSLYLLAYDESDVYDEEALAAASDYVIVQGYDLHARTEGTTGPIAPLQGWGNRNWQSVLEGMIARGVPRDKIVMSVPYFGYEWPAESDAPGARTHGSARTVRYAAGDSASTNSANASAQMLANEHGLQRDEASGSPYYTYRDSSGWRQGWFEDPQSLAAKYDWIADQGLRGVAVFPIAYGTPELEELLRRAFHPIAP